MSNKLKAIEQLKGVYTALVTPFWQGRVDFPSLERLVSEQLQAGIRGFVVNGTTAESPTLLEHEVEEIFFFVKKMLPPDARLILGVGSNSTQHTLEKVKKAQDWGAHAFLVVVPYYNKPPQRGLYQHFVQIAEQSLAPVILYNVPSRTVTHLEIKTIADLSSRPNILGIKEASGNIPWDKELMAQVGGNFLYLSGDDATYEEFLALGGHGIISVASHILPQAYLQGEIKKYLPLIQSLYMESNPIPVKMALYLLGLIRSPECRLPLVEGSPETRNSLQASLKSYGLLK